MLVTFLLGYHGPFGRVLAARLPDFSGKGRHRLSSRWIERTALLASLVGGAISVDYQGGLMAMLGRGYGMGRSGPMFTAVFLMLLLSTMLLAWRVIGSVAPNRWAIATLVSLLGFEIVWWGILLGQRKWLFHLFFGLVTMFLLRRGTRAIPRFVLPTILVALVIYLSVWGSVRGRPVADLATGSNDAHYGETESMGHGYIEGIAGPFGAACLTFEVFPDIEPFRHGQTPLVALLSPIPRAVWPDKPIGLGKEITRYIGGYYGLFYDPTQSFSITPTIVGDLYANFGVTGILLGGLFVGILLRAVAIYSTTGMHDGLQYQAARVLIPTLVLAGLVEVRADLGMMTLFYMYTLLPLLVMLTFFSFESERAPEEVEAVDGAHFAMQQ